MAGMITLSGKKGLVVGIANEHSLAYGCARHFRAAGAELAITYLNSKAEPYVRPLANAMASAICLPCDLTKPGELQAHRNGLGTARFCASRGRVRA